MIKCGLVGVSDKSSGRSSRLPHATACDAMTKTLRRGEFPIPCSSAGLSNRYDDSCGSRVVEVVGWVNFNSQLLLLKTDALRN